MNHRNGDFPSTDVINKFSISQRNGPVSYYKDIKKEMRNFLNDPACVRLKA